MTERLNTGIGAELRQAREAAGLSVDDVALQLKYASRQIESLENERFDRLPGPTIARGMVRNYARLLKLDPEPLVSRMAPAPHAPAEPAAQARPFSRPVPFSDGARRSTLIYVAFSIGILMLAGVLTYGWHQERAAPEFVTPLAQQPEEPPPAAEDPSAQAAAAPAPPQEPPPAPVQEPTSAKVQEAPPAKVQQAPPAKVVEPPKAPADGGQRLVLRAAEDAWMEVRDAAGRQLVYSLAPGGSERVVQGDAPFELVIGNAQHVTVHLDGRAIDLKPHTRRDVARFVLK